MVEDFLTIFLFPDSIYLAREEKTGADPAGSCFGLAIARHAIAGLFGGAEGLAVHVVDQGSQEHQPDNAPAPLSHPGRQIIFSRTCRFNRGMLHNGRRLLWSEPGFTPGEAGSGTRFAAPVHLPGLSFRVPAIDR